MLGQPKTWFDTIWDDHFSPINSGFDDGFSLGGGGVYQPAVDIDFFDAGLINNSLSESPVITLPTTQTQTPTTATTIPTTTAQTSSGVVIDTETLLILGGGALVLILLLRR